MEKPTFYAFDFYHCTERRFLSQNETYNLCRWLEIKHVPMAHVDHWRNIYAKLANLTPAATLVNKDCAHPVEGIVVRPYLMNGIANDFNGNRNLLAGKLINPAYLDFRHKNEPEEEDAGPEFIGGPI